MVSKILTFITGRLNPWIIESIARPQSIKQDDQTFISILDYTRDSLGQIKSKFWIASK